MKESEGASAHHSARSLEFADFMSAKGSDREHRVPTLCLGTGLITKSGHEL